MTEAAEQGSDRLSRALEVALFAPLGLGLYLKDMAPSFLGMFVTRGRAELDRRQEQVDQRVRHAKGMGEVAVAFGLPVLRKMADEKVTSVRGRAATTLRAAGLRSGVSPSGGSGKHATEAPRAERPAAARASDRGPSVPLRQPRARAAEPSLAIPGYDILSASQVVEHLAGLGAEELEAVRAYESSHRNRRTIIGKIDQLAH